MWCGGGQTHGHENRNSDVVSLKSGTVRLGTPSWELRSQNGRRWARGRRTPKVRTPISTINRQMARLNRQTARLNARLPIDKGQTQRSRTPKVRTPISTINRQTARLNRQTARLNARLLTDKGQTQRSRTPTACRRVWRLGDRP